MRRGADGRPIEWPTGGGRMSIERRIVTVLFADLVDFTPLSERLDAEDLATIQDAYFAVVRDTVGRYGGTLEKFIGDAVMAAFGLGTARDDDAERAVRAGLALIHGVESLGARLGLDVDALRIRVGVNTGEAVVGASGPVGRPGHRGGKGHRRHGQRGRPAPGGGLDRAGSSSARPRHWRSKGRSSSNRRRRSRSRARPNPCRRALVDCRPSGTVARPGDGRDGRADVVGRGEELDRLVAASERARAGPTQRVLVVAPPGVGKSRLLGELAGSIDDGATVVWRTRSRQGDERAVRPRSRRPEAAAAVATVAGGRGGGLVARVEAIGVSPARARVVVDAGPTAAGTGIDDRAATCRTIDAPDRRDLFAAWTTVLRACAADRSVCWLTEDLHWAGADEIAFIEGLTADADWHRLLVVATGRQSVTGRVDKDWTSSTSPRWPSAIPGSRSKPSSATPCRPTSWSGSSIAPMAIRCSSRSCFGRGSASGRWNGPGRADHGAWPQPRPTSRCRRRSRRSTPRSSTTCPARRGGPHVVPPSPGGGSRSRPSPSWARRTRTLRWPSSLGARS